MIIIQLFGIVHQITDFDEFCESLLGKTQMDGPRWAIDIIQTSVHDTLWASDWSVKLHYQESW